MSLTAYLESLDLRSWLDAIRWFLNSPDGVFVLFVGVVGWLLFVAVRVHRAAHSIEVRSTQFAEDRERERQLRAVVDIGEFRRRA